MILALLPLATTVLTAYALRPRDAIAPRRLAVVRAAVAVGVFAVLGVEALSAARAIDRGSLVALWTTGLLTSGVLAAWRGRRDGAGGGPRAWRDAVRRLSPIERVVSAGIGLLVAAELVLALVSAPNNYDSNYYHLPKVEHWVAQHSVELYPTLMRPQVVLAPGAEYLLLHLRLLTGGDRLHNLVQWGAALGCALVASRVAAQLGAGRLGQLLAAATVATAPMVVLESTSTQNDLVVAAWVMCAATLVVDELGRRTGPAGVLGIGAAAGLAVVTKPTGWLALAPVLLLWGLARMRRGWRAVLPAAAATVAVLALVGVLAGLYLARVNAEFGSPLGPPEQSSGLSLQRHDPAAVLVNALRIGASTLVVPVPAVNRAVADGVIAVSHAVGVNPQDEAITVATSTYPNALWWADEDQSPYPVQAFLVLIATAAVLLGRRVPGRVRAYGLAVAGALLAYAAVLKWQPWGNRLVGTALVLGAPLVGLLLGRAAAVTGPRWRRVTVAAAVTVVMIAAGTHGYVAVLRGAPRPILGEHSMFTRDRWDQRFARYPQWADDYAWGAETVRASGARRIGIVVRGDNWEYPWWVALPGRELVALESVLPHHPAAPPSSVDAILCMAPADACRFYVPKGWRFEVRDGWFGVAVPPASPGAAADGRPGG
jgi:hypothetical protein